MTSDRKTGMEGVAEETGITPAKITNPTGELPRNWGRSKTSRRYVRRVQSVRRILGVDIEPCPDCGGAVRIIACIEDQLVIEKILAHLDAKAAEPEASRRPSCRAPPRRRLFD